MKMMKTFDSRTVLLDIDGYSYIVIMVYMVAKFWRPFLRLFQRSMIQAHSNCLFSSLFIFSCLVGECGGTPHSTKKLLEVTNGTSVGPQTSLPTDRVTQIRPNQVWQTRG